MTYLTVGNNKTSYQKLLWASYRNNMVFPFQVIHKGCHLYKYKYVNLFFICHIFQCITWWRHVIEQNYIIHVLDCWFHSVQGPWTYGSWIYDYLCNQCISPLKLWIRTPFMAMCTRINIMWYNLSVTCNSLVTNKTDRHDMTEILLTVVLNSINQLI